MRRTEISFLAPLALFFLGNFVETHSYLSEFNRSNFSIKMNNIPPTHMPSKGGDKELVVA